MPQKKKVTTTAPVREVDDSWMIPYRKSRPDEAARSYPDERRQLNWKYA